jgi:hypothetical protein
MRMVLAAVLCGAMLTACASPDGPKRLSQSGGAPVARTGDADGGLIGVPYDIPVGRGAGDGR